MQIFYNTHIVGFLGFMAFGFMHHNSLWAYTLPGAAPSPSPRTACTLQLVSRRIVASAFFFHAYLVLFTAGNSAGDRRRMEPMSWCAVLSECLNSQQMHTHFECTLCVQFRFQSLVLTAVESGSGLRLQVAGLGLN